MTKVVQQKVASFAKPKIFSWFLFLFVWLRWLTYLSGTQNKSKLKKEKGIDVPEGVEVKVVEDIDKIVHFILSPEPSDKFSDEDLTLLIIS